jgi:hypothetical protein
MAATERIPVLLTREQKTRLARRAKAANLTMGEYVRRAAEAYQPDADDEELDRLIERVRKTTDEAAQAMERALSSVARSQKRISDMEVRHARKRAA